MKNRSPQISVLESRHSFGWIDLTVFLGLIGLLWGAAHFGEGMFVHFDASRTLTINTDIRKIPYYACRTLLRMWIAFAFSLLFTMVVGYAAAKSRAARSVILPAIDILQSVPVLGFLSATVIGFMALFPGSLFGVECASIFAIFTSQVWNMTFGFYHSLVTIPTDLQEAAESYGLNRWQRFTTVEVPASMHSLIWNSMMSFAGGWFFVTASEAISVMNKNIELPGLGSFMAEALKKGDNHAALWAILAMLAVILVSDQFIWRPLLAWANKFKMELTESSHPPTSWFYSFLGRAYLFTWWNEKIVRPFFDWLKNITQRVRLPVSRERKRRVSVANWVLAISGIAVGLWIGYYAVRGIFMCIAITYEHVTFDEVRHIAWLGFLTLLRVAVMTVVATLIWTPIGVWIGLNPKAARIAQPISQLAASFPVNMTFPIVVGLFVAYHISINWGSIFLIGMGTQWYILFNVIAGAMAIPNDLMEAAQTYGLRGRRLWRTLIIPAIFPFWITGACTAAGGAWNASIVAEVVSYGKTTLTAKGLGAYIADVTTKGDTPLIICSIAIMSLFVVIINKLLWRRLYGLAERRYRLD